MAQSQTKVLAKPSNEMVLRVRSTKSVPANGKAGMTRQPGTRPLQFDAVYVAEGSRCSKQAQEGRRKDRPWPAIPSRRR